MSLDDEMKKAKQSEWRCESQIDFDILFWLSKTASASLTLLA